MNTFSDILTELNKFNSSSAADFDFSEEDCAFLNEQSRIFNEDLAKKEAGSWESANRLVLTD